MSKLKGERERKWERTRERGRKKDFITAVINDKQVQAGQVVLQGEGGVVDVRLAKGAGSQSASACY